MHTKFKKKKQTYNINTHMYLVFACVSMFKTIKIYECLYPNEYLSAQKLSKNELVSIFFKLKILKNQIHLN